MAFWNERLPQNSQGPLFIGILNVTPDSFSDGGRFQSPEAAVVQARRLVEAGAGMLDVGAESTRPGAASVSAAEEWARLEGVIKALREALPDTSLSLDTRHFETAQRGLNAGVAVLNEVTGFSDPAMLDLARGSDCGLIAMRSTQREGRLLMPPYEGPPAGDPAAELRRVRDRLLGAGIDPHRILLDPGFGFGTTFEGDSALWADLPHLPARLDWPVDRFCLGISRKRFLAWRNGTSHLPPAARDSLTTQAHAEAAALGYRFFRTHSLPR